jgi:translation initiation factor IF-3
VLVSVFFKGRQINYKEQGELILLKFADQLKDLGTPENLPKLEGKRMQIMLRPKK